MGVELTLPIAFSLSLRSTEVKPKKRRPNSALGQNKLLSNANGLTASAVEETGDVDMAYHEIARIVGNSIRPRKIRRSKPWFDAECYETFRMLRESTSESARTGDIIELQTQRGVYRALLRSKKVNDQAEKGMKLIEQAAKNLTSG